LRPTKRPVLRVGVFQIDTLHGVNPIRTNPDDESRPGA